ncbi:UNVERIFIED_CONTAM: UDP-xylose transporter 3 [Sesamum radiatum]|uniref:UDP-xylose transporter 3 n=1 Tax=Sesamum radiatum TaxID=300843 RepID=A0AAW2W1H0_SESRA
MGFGILNGTSIGLLNLSLGFNSVGFYQMTKLAIIPCTVLLEILFFRKIFSRNVQLSLTVLLLGVGIATVTDLQLNVLGSILSLLAVVTTCVAQIAFIVLSCFISVAVNFSTFLVIGKTSPVTYQVLGHLKTCLVLAFGYVLLRDPFSWRNILGILIAMVGMVLYSYCCTAESQQKVTTAEATQLSQAKESESDPLLGVENGGGILTDDGVTRTPGWNLNKDLQA